MNIQIIIEYNKFLKELYSLTNNSSILLINSSLKQLKPKILKYLDVLKQLNIIMTYDNDSKIIWKGDVPNISMAYDFYNTITKKSKKFLDLKNIIDSPEKYKSTELMEALELNNIYNNETGKSFIDNDVENTSMDLCFENNDMIIINETEPINNNKENLITKTDVIVNIDDDTRFNLDINLNDKLNKDIINYYKKSNYPRKQIAVILYKKYQPNIEYSVFVKRIHKRIDRLRNKGLIVKNRNNVNFSLPLNENAGMTIPTLPLTNISLNSKEYQELNKNFENLKKENQSLQTNYNILDAEKKLLVKQIENNKNIEANINNTVNKEMSEFMSTALKLLGLITKDTIKIEAIHGMQRKTIGMLNSIQNNSVVQSKLIHAILLDIQSNYTEANIHEDISKRKQNITNALQISEKIKIYNDNNSHYGNNNI